MAEEKKSEKKRPLATVIYDIATTVAVIGTTAVFVGTAVANTVRMLHGKLPTFDPTNPTLG